MSVPGTVAGSRIQTHHQSLALLGMGPGTPIRSMDGTLPVEYLEPGDRIITRAGVRRLLQVETTRIRHARVIRLTRDVLGHDRPAADLILRPDQPVLLRDWRAQALYGAAEAMVPARRIVDGEFIRAEVVEDLRVFRLCFAEEVVIYAGGIELGCAPLTVSA